MVDKICGNCGCEMSPKYIQVSKNFGYKRAEDFCRECEKQLDKEGF